MKKRIAALVLLIAFTTSGQSQNINWRSINSNEQNLVQFNFGYDFGVTAQFGFSRMVTLIKPTMLGIDVSFPMGNNLIDDFTVRLGGQMELAEFDGFCVSVKIASNFRRYQTNFVRIVSFGSDFAAVAGYYGDSWHAAGEFGFDKAIATDLIHSDIIKSYYPEIRDGWYVPTGGHYYYGLQAGKALGEHLDLGLRFGATKAQFNDEEAILPYYFQMGLGMKF